jgi:hypothetical protein
VLPDGCLVLVGRKDARTKLNGRFVDTARTETALLAHPGVGVAVVVIREDRPGHQRLVAYVVPTAASTPTALALRAHVQARLGDQPGPSTFVFLETLPRTANGKVDRRALPMPDRGRPALTTPYRAPESPVERAVAAIWAEVLDLDAVGLDDDFVELGGTSLLAGHIAARVSQQLNVELTPHRLMDLPRVTEMAMAVVEQLMGQAGPAERQRLFATEAPAAQPRSDRGGAPRARPPDAR